MQIEKVKTTIEKDTGEGFRGFKVRQTRWIALAELLGLGTLPSSQAAMEEIDVYISPSVLLGDPEGIRAARQNEVKKALLVVCS